MSRRSQTCSPRNSERRNSSFVQQKQKQVRGVTPRTCFSSLGLLGQRDPGRRRLLLPWPSPRVASTIRKSDMRRRKAWGQDALFAQAGGDRTPSSAVFQPCAGSRKEEAWAHFLCFLFSHLLPLRIGEGLGGQVLICSACLRAPAPRRARRSTQERFLPKPAWWRGWSAPTPPPSPPRRANALCSHVPRPPSPSAPC